MKIYRNIDRKIHHHGFASEFELTPDELRRAYEEQQWIYYVQDIAQNVADRIEDADDPDFYADDWPYRVGEANADKLRDLLYNNERYGEVFRDMVDLIVDRQLEELGIDPETMREEAR